MFIGNHTKRALYPGYAARAVSRVIRPLYIIRIVGSRGVLTKSQVGDGSIPPCHHYLSVGIPSTSLRPPILSPPTSSSSSSSLGCALATGGERTMVASIGYTSDVGVVSQGAATADLNRG